VPHNDYAFARDGLQKSAFATAVENLATPRVPARRTIAVQRWSRGCRATLEPFRKLLSDPQILLKIIGSEKRKMMGRGVLNARLCCKK
jgi:hypothetical protein